MNNLGNLCFISLAVCLMSTVLVQTEVSQPSNDDPLNSLDTNADNFTDVAVGEVEHEHFEDGNHKNLTINTEGEEKGGEKCSSYEIASKDDILSLKNTLGDILGKAMDEFKFMGDRMNRLEESISTSSGSYEIASKDDISSLNETLGDMLRKSMDDFKMMRDRINRLEESMSTLTNCTSNPPLSFHSSFYGEDIELSREYHIATRFNPEENNGYGSVVSQRTLCADEVFKFRIEETITDWKKYGIQIGVIIDPETDVKTSRTTVGNDEIKGAWTIRSWPASNSGTSDTYIGGFRKTRDGYPLQTSYLRAGTVLGVSRRKNGDVHFYQNDIDKGIAFKDVPKGVYAFVDIINYVTKISIVD